MQLSGNLLDVTWGSAIVVVCLCYHIQASSQASSQENKAHYCESETFQASCGDDESILMTSAKYGRMEIGRCITQSYGHIGCSVDVLDVMDSFCSGKKTCQIGANHQALLKKKKLSCPKDVAAYLVASYTCVKTTALTSCNKKFQILTGESGFLSLSTNNQGRSDPCPLIIRPSSGRQLNITMYSFLPPPAPNQPLTSSSACYEIGTIKDADETHTVHKCLNDKRRKGILVSNGNQIEVKVTSPQTTETSGAFLLHYEVVGCADPTIPEKTKLQRSGSTAKVTCESSDESWSLSCASGEWIGELGTCTSAGIFSEDGWSFLGLFDHSHPFGTAIVVGIGATLGVLVGGIILYILIAIFKRCQREEYRNYEYTDNNFTHIPVDFHGDKTDLVFNDANNSQFGTWGPRSTLSHSEHARMPLPPLPKDNNTLSYEKPLINRNQSESNNI